MSDAISRRIKQLENQNRKFKKLLESTLRLTCEDTAKCLELQNEANFLKKVVSDLENQKKQLEDELRLYLTEDACNLDALPDVDVQSKLNNALNDIQRGSTEIQQLKTEDGYLKAVISDLEQEKEKLLNDIRLVKKVNEENNALEQENLKLKQELALLESQTTTFSYSCSGQDLVKKLVSLENLKQSLQADIRTAKKTTDLLETPVENTVLELKISGVEKQKEIILRNLKTSLLQAANEISTLHSNASDDQLRRLLNELDIHKTLLMMNLNDLKDMYDAERHLIDYTNQEIDVRKFLNADECSEPAQSSSFSSNSSEMIEQITEIKELPTVSEEEEESQNDLLAEREQLIQDIDRLELEKEELLKQIESVNSQRNFQSELHSTFMREASSEKVHRLSLDDATNQMYANQEQLLAQRIRELEDDNARIRRSLSLMLQEAQSDKEDLEVLEEGERLIRNLKERN